MIKRTCTRYTIRKHSCETTLLGWNGEMHNKMGIQGVSLLCQRLQAAGGWSGTDSKGTACKMVGEEERW